MDLTSRGDLATGSPTGGVDSDFGRAQFGAQSAITEQFRVFAEAFNRPLRPALKATRRAICLG